MKIIDYLERNALTAPDRAFVAQSDGEVLSYLAFWNRVVERADEFQLQYAGKQAVVLRVSQTIDYLISYFACHKAGKVIVPLEHDFPEEKVAEIRAIVDSQRFPNEASDVLFTTGTTGTPKGVVLSHKALLADAENLSTTLGFDANLTFIINGPLNHFGSHSKVLPVVRTGGAIFLMEGMKSMEDFYGAIDSVQGKVATFLVPASIRMLIQFSSSRLASYASRIEFIETGAAPITQTDMQHLAKLLPQSRLYNTYAGSEVGVVCTYNFNDGNAFQGCVGRNYPLSHVELRDGVVVCSGDGLMMGYLGQPLVETLPEIVTSDLGQLDTEGRLFLVGRSNDIINVGGMKVSPIEVEEAATSVIEDLKDCICIARPHSMMGAVPVLLVVMPDGVPLDKKSVARALRQRLEAYKVPVNIIEVDHIERTFNGKVNRKFYQS